MSPSEGSSLKRKRPGSSVEQGMTEQERILYELIRSKENMGMWRFDMKRESKLPDTMVNKALKALLTKNLIKEVVNIQNKGKKHYMAAEFEPSKEISGGTWYTQGNLDTDLIEVLKITCAKFIKDRKVATVEGIADFIRSRKILNVELTRDQILEILKALVLDKKVLEAKSNGMGEFGSIPIGKICYKAVGGEERVAAMATIPCGVCPRISLCTPDGVISPITCVYYKKWLDF